MTFLRTATLAAFLAATAFSAHAETVRLDEAQLDRVTAGFVDFPALFEQIDPLLPEGVELPAVQQLPSSPSVDFPSFDDLPAEPPFGALPGFLFAR